MVLIWLFSGNVNSLVCGWLKMFWLRRVSGDGLCSVELIDSVCFVLASKTNELQKNNSIQVDYGPKL